MTEIYIDDERLFALADAIAALKPCAWAGKITRDQILIALGEHGDLWPFSVLPEVKNDRNQAQSTLKPIHI